MLTANINIIRSILECKMCIYYRLKNIYAYLLTEIHHTVIVSFINNNIDSSVHFVSLTLRSLGMTWH